MSKIRTALPLCACLASVCFLFTGEAVHAFSGDETPEAKPVVTNLDNPTGLAIQPETGHVFIASHPAVYRFVSGKPGKVYLEVIGFPTDIYGKGPKYEVGPLGLGFLGNNHLVVGDGSRPDGEELLRIYEVGNDPRQAPRKEDDAAHTLGPIEKSEQTNSGEGNFYGVAVNSKAIFVSCNGDDRKGWVAKAAINDGKPGELNPSIATKEATEVNAPVPVIYSPDETELVIGQMGAINVPADSLLTFYDPESGELKKSLRTELNDITALAYSPKTGNLYATDFSWIDTSRGGLFRLNVDGDDVEVEEIMSLDKPTSMVFDEEGRLYITVMGTAEEGSDKAPGKVLRIDSGL